MTPRTAGSIAAVVLGLFVLLVAGLSFTAEEVVVPTNGVTAGGARDNPARDVGAAALAARARLQQWPEADESATNPGLALDSGETAKQAAGGGEQWRSDRAAVKDILQEPRMLRGVSTLPAAETGVLVQPQGRSWRNWHNDQIAYGGGLYIFGISFLIALFLAWRGRIPIKEGESGQTVQRFGAFERANHWLTAVSFLLMALTGLVILYGNALIRPWLGAGPYAELARTSAWSHMTFAVPFVIGVLVMIALWLRDNLPERLDWEWLKRGGGFVGHAQENPPARKFNAGQKLVFWGVVLGGLFLTITGLGLMFPFFWTGYTGMQLTQTLHAAAALLMVGLIIGHIYIGTVGMRGAFEAMWSGRVDTNWAKEHHSLWYPKVAQGADTSPAARARRPGHGAAIATFASGGVAAALLALLMLAIYQTASISQTQRTTASNPSVHVEAERGSVR